MNKKLARLFCLVLCAVMVCGLLPAGAGATEIQNRSITQEENEYFFTTFADLKELAAGTYENWTSAIYLGESPLVISEDMTLPANLCLYFVTDSEIIVNEGVTFDLTNYCTGGKWTVNGILINRIELANVAVLAVNGSLVNYGSLRPSSNSTVSGLENITNQDHGYIWWAYTFTDADSMMILLSEAAAHPENEYEFYAEYETDLDVQVTKDLTIPSNVWLHGETDFSLTIDAGAELLLEGELSMYGGTLTVNGTLNNEGSLHLAWINDGAYHYGSLVMGSTGTYTGHGDIYIAAGERTDINDFITGLNLSLFDIEVNEYEGTLSGWCLSIPGEDLPEESVLPFEDLEVDAFYLEPVIWAIEMNITNGLSETEFGPDVECTRGQIVTFLWRSCGEPEPISTENPFSDVKQTDYFYKPVLWALEQGITTGLTATEFGPEVTCTRSQVATFLWRTAGKEDPASPLCPFVDVAADAYYYNAVLWAVENGITNGMGDGIFAPDATCTRGQIVTFLFRTLT